MLLPSQLPLVPCPAAGLPATSLRAAGASWSWLGGVSKCLPLLPLVAAAHPDATSTAAAAAAAVEGAPFLWAAVLPRSRPPPAWRNACCHTMQECSMHALIAAMHAYSFTFKLYFPIMLYTVHSSSLQERTGSFLPTSNGLVTMTATFTYSTRHF